MPDKIEKIVRATYRRWKRSRGRMLDWHPGEEDLAGFLEGNLSEEDSSKVRQHVLECEDCAEALALNFAAEGPHDKDVPPEMLEAARGLLGHDPNSLVMEIALRLKDKIFEVINTTGDILVGQELVPAPVLRSRHLNDFKDEVKILKDFKDTRVEVRVENKGSGIFNLSVSARQKQTQKVIKDLRITLLRDDIEMESYLNSAGSVTFEHILLGRYTVELATPERKIASVLLDIKI